MIHTSEMKCKGIIVPSSSSSLRKRLPSEKRKRSQSNLSKTDDASTEIIDTKQVNFNECVKVILIPSRAEYVKRGLAKYLWWTQQDYFSFQQEARSEIQLYAIVQRISFLEARRKLYQPSTEGTDFFIAGSSSCQDEEEDDYLIAREGPPIALNGDGPRTLDEQANAKLHFYQSPNSSVDCGLDRLSNRSGVSASASVPALKFPCSPSSSLRMRSAVTVVASESEEDADDLVGAPIDVPMEVLYISPRQLEVPKEKPTVEELIVSVSTSVSASATESSSSASAEICSSSSKQSVGAVKPPSVVDSARSDGAEPDDDLDVRLCVPLSQYAPLRPPGDSLPSIAPSITLCSAIALAAVVVLSRFI